MTLILTLLVVTLLVGLVLSFGPACVEMLLHWGASVEAVSLEIVITFAVMTLLLIMLWVFNSLVSKEDSWLYKNMVSVGNEANFYKSAKKAINVLFVVIIVVYAALIAVMLLNDALGMAELAVNTWRVKNEVLLGKLERIGNMNLSAAAAFAISIGAIAIPAFKKKGKGSSGNHSRANNDPKEEE